MYQYFIDSKVVGMFGVNYILDCTQLNLLEI